MSGSVTYCKDCGACNWAGKKECSVCGGELEPTLAEVHAYYYQTDPEFKKMVDDQRERDRQCPECGFPIDRVGFIKRQDYNHDADYNCPNCGHNLISIRLTKGCTHIKESK